MQRIKDAQKMLNTQRIKDTELDGLAAIENVNAGEIDVVVEEEDLDEQPGLHLDIHGDDIADEEMEALLPDIISHFEVW